MKISSGMADAKVAGNKGVYNMCHKDLSPGPLNTTTPHLSHRASAQRGDLGPVGVLRNGVVVGRAKAR